VPLSSPTSLATATDMARPGEMIDGSPSLLILDQPTTRKVSLVTFANHGQLSVTTRLWVTNCHPSTSLMLIAVRIEGARYDSSKVVSRTNIGKVYQGGSAAGVFRKGGGPPPRVAPGQTIDIECAFVLAADADGHGGWCTPKTIVATVVLKDQFGKEYASDQLHFR
jgi:hypothetical protein